MYVGKGRLITHYTPLQNTQLIENYVVSNAKIKSAIGIELMPIRAKDGLAETISSFCEL